MSPPLPTDSSIETGSAPGVKLIVPRTLALLVLVSSYGVPAGPIGSPAGDDAAELLLHRQEQAGPDDEDQGPQGRHGSEPCRPEDVTGQAEEQVGEHADRGGGDADPQQVTPGAEHLEDQQHGAEGQPVPG